AFSTVNWGAILSPFFVGMIADRFFPAEKVMAFIHLAGGILLFTISTIVDPIAFFWTLLAYALLYMPTIGLANSIAFYQMENPEKEFPSVRVLGTIGWIVAGLIIGFLGLDASGLVFKIGAACSVVLGVYSLFLPHTPPKSKNEKVGIKDILGLDALILFKKRSFSIFILC